MRSKLFYMFVCGFIAATTPISTTAQQKFSRACSFEDIPTSLRNPFLILRDIIGEGASGSFNYLRTADANTRRNHYILESLTVDYFNVQFALYAENQVYVLYCPVGQVQLNSQCNWRIDYTFKSAGNNGWVAQSLNPVTIADTRLSIFFTNRGFLYSARAGHPSIIQNLTPPPPSNGLLFANPVVVGNHAFRDNAGLERSLGKSVASNCNLSEWGLGAR